MPGRRCRRVRDTFKVVGSRRGESRVDHDALCAGLPTPHILRREVSPEPPETFGGFEGSYLAVLP